MDRLSFCLFALYMCGVFSPCDLSLSTVYYSFIRVLNCIPHSALRLPSSVFPTSSFDALAIFLPKPFFAFLLSYLNFCFHFRRGRVFFPSQSFHLGVISAQFPPPSRLYLFEHTDYTMWF